MSSGSLPAQNPYPAIAGPYQYNCNKGKYKKAVTTAWTRKKIDCDHPCELSVKVVTSLIHTYICPFTGSKQKFMFIILLLIMGILLLWLYVIGYVQYVLLVFIWLFPLQLLWMGLWMTIFHHQITPREIIETVLRTDVIFIGVSLIALLIHRLCP